MDNINKDPWHPSCRVFVEGGALWEVNWKGICAECASGPDRDKCDSHRRYGCEYHEGDFFFHRKESE